MKKSILFLVAFIATLTAQAQQCFTIKGELPDSLDGAEIQLLDYEDNHVCATTILKDGRFEIKGEIERDSIRRIDIYHNDKSAGYANLIAEAGEITVDLDKHLAHGTPLNDAMVSLEFESRFKELHNRWNAYRDDPSHTPEQIESMDSVFYKEAKQIINEVLPAHIKTAKENDNALGCWAMWLLTDLLEDNPEQFLQIYSEASPYVQHFGPVYRLKQTLENSLAVSVGSQFKDLTFPTGNLDGTPAKLSDYVGRGKYILVDFWASWCGPCRGETPNLKAVYDRFHGEKFDILSVAIHDYRENTLQLVADEQIPWPQILDAQFSDVQAYGSDGIPLIILFSPDGTILAYKLRGAEIMKAVEKALAE